MKLIYAPQVSILPSDWTFDYHDGSITSPTNWVYYPKVKKAITPEGDIWFEDFESVPDFIDFFKLLDLNENVNFIV